MTIEIDYTPDDLGLFSKMIIHFLKRESTHIHVEKVSTIFKVFSEMIQDSIGKETGREVGHLGHFTKDHLAAWNHTIINHLVNSEEGTETRDKIISLWHEIEMIIDYHIQLFEQEEMAVRWGLK